MDTPRPSPRTNRTRRVPLRHPSQGLGARRRNAACALILPPCTQQPCSWQAGLTQQQQPHISPWQHSGPGRSRSRSINSTCDRARDRATQLWAQVDSEAAQPWLALKHGARNLPPRPLPSSGTNRTRISPSPRTNRTRATARGTFSPCASRPSRPPAARSSPPRYCSPCHLPHSLAPSPPPRLLSSPAPGVRLVREEGRDASS